MMQTPKACLLTLHGHRQVEFVGPYPMEGAKGVDSAVTRHTARLLRHVAQRPPPVNHTLLLRVAEGGGALEGALVEDGTEGDPGAAGAAASEAAAAAGETPAGAAGTGKQRGEAAVGSPPDAALDATAAALSAAAEPAAAADGAGADAATSSQPASPPPADEASEHLQAAEAPS